MQHRDLNLMVTREGNAITVRSSYPFGWAGVLFGGFAVFGLSVWIRQEGANQTPVFFGGVLLCIALILMALHVVVPRRLETVFDLRARRVHQHLRYYRGLYERKRTYAFADVELLGVREFGGEDANYKPYLKARDGTTLWLTTASADLNRSDELIADICALTSLARRDLAS